MPLVPTALWEAAFAGTPRLDIFASVTIDESAGTVLEFVSSPHTSQRGIPRLIGQMAPIGPKIDPLTFKNDTKAEFNLSLVESELTRHYLSTHVFMGKKLELKIGASGLISVATDYLPMWRGFIADVEPEEGGGGYNLRCKGAWHPLLTKRFRKQTLGLGDSTVADGWYGFNYLEILHELVEDALDSNWINATSFDPDDASNDDVGHYLIGRGVHGPHDRRILKDVSLKGLIDELSEVYQTAVIPREDGLMTAVPYRPSAAAEGIFPAQHIVPGTWEMGPLYQNIINEVIYYFAWKGQDSGQPAEMQSGSDSAVEDTFGSGRTADIGRANPSDWEIRYSVSDAASQDKYKFDNVSGGDRNLDNEIQDQWHGCRGTLADDIDVGAGPGSTFRVYGGWTFAFAGGAFTGLNSERRLTSSKRAILKIGGELIALRDCTQTLTEVIEEPTGGPYDNDDIVSTVTLGAKVFALEFTIDERGVDGSPIATHLADVEVWDWTAPYDHTDKKLIRHADGAQIARFDTPILPDTVKPQAAELWTFSYFRWISEGNDGLSGAKVQITEKTWDPDQGVIHWEICLVATATLSRQPLDFPVFPLNWQPFKQIIDLLGAGSVLTPFIGEGLTLSGVGGLSASVAAGRLIATGSDAVMSRLQSTLARTLVINRDYYVYWDHYAHAVIWYERTTGAGEPTLKPPNLELLAEIIVGGTQIDTVNDKRQRLGITGPSVRDFPGAKHFPTLQDAIDFGMDKGQLLLVDDRIWRVADSAFDDLLLANSPFGIYDMDETSGTTITDTSGNGNDGVYRNSPVLGNAALVPDGGKSVGFTGADNKNGRISFAAVTLSSLSIELWLKGTGDASRANAYFQLFDTANTVAEFQMFHSAGSKSALDFIIGGTLFTVHGALPKDLFLDGQIHQVVVTWAAAGSLTKIYLDGVKIAEAQTLGVNLADVDEWNIGNTNAETAALDADIDKFAIYHNTVLTADEVATRYVRGRSDHVDVLPTLDLLEARTSKGQSAFANTEFRAFVDSNVTVSPSTTAVIIFDDDLETDFAYDWGRNYSTTTGLYTAPEPGWYEFDTHVWADAADASRDPTVSIEINRQSAGFLPISTTRFRPGSAQIDTWVVSTRGPIFLAAGDQVRVFLDGDGGTGWTYYGVTGAAGGDRTVFAGRKVRDA